MGCVLALQAGTLPTNWFSSTWRLLCPKCIKMEWQSAAMGISSQESCFSMQSWLSQMLSCFSSGVLLWQAKFSSFSIQKKGGNVQQYPGETGQPTHRSNSTRMASSPFHLSHQQLQQHSVQTHYLGFFMVKKKKKGSKLCWLMWTSQGKQWV